MGKQLNAREKRQRRKRYLKRLKERFRKEEPVKKRATKKK
ncbi:MAG: hypothetical protein Kow00108_18200 [Calditrichia bacterium]